MTYHLHSEKPLFKRAIAMSGTSLLSQALPYEEHEKNYQEATVALGLADLSPTQRVQSILEMPENELIGKLPPSILTKPAVDTDIVLHGVTYSDIGRLDSKALPGKAWCSDLLIGDAEMDVRVPYISLREFANRNLSKQASIFEFLAPDMKNDCARKFSSAVKKVLGSHPQEQQRILAAYKITETTPDEEAIFSVLQFISDIIFHAPVLAFASGWMGNAYVYHFNEGNPWHGPWEGRANHILDVAYLFQNFSEHLSPEQNRVCAAFAEDFFKFCHGVAPWPTVTPGEVRAGFSARVYGPSHQGATTRVTTQAFGEESRRRSVLFDCASTVSLDQLATVLAVFQSE